MRQRVAVPAFLVVSLVFLGFRLLDVAPWDDPLLDLHAYWATRFGIDYATEPGVMGAYLYSPAFAQALVPLTLLPWPVFAAAWTGLILTALLWLSGRWALPALILPPVALSVFLGQVDLIIAVAIVLGFRHPSAWVVPIIMKATPGVGLVWFLVRREWRALWLAGAATIGVVAVSAALDPGAWGRWIELLRASVIHPMRGGAQLEIPIAIRLVTATAIIAWGAQTDRRWTVPVGVILAMPLLWFQELAILLAALPFAEAGRLTPAAAWLRAKGLIGPIAQRLEVRRVTSS